MGLKIKDIIVKEEISIRDLNKKIVAIDTMNMLYQFLTTIRQPDGKVLTNSKGKVTSHLIGLFSRTTHFMERGLKPVFVFDGKAPEIKIKTWEKRTAIKKEASLKLQEAEEAGDIEAMRKFSSRTVKLDKEMIEDSKRLIKSLGLPIVQAKSEGEAQTAYMVKTGVAYASISQDYDNLIFGCPLLVRNLSIEGKRKKVGKFAYKTVKPEAIKLEEVLKKLDITHNQLIVLAILVGTDYNPDGIKGIGQKKALKLIKEQRDNFNKIFEIVEWGKNCPEISWKEIYDTIKNIPVSDEQNLEWHKINDEEVINLLVDEYEFGRDRVESKLEKLRKQQGELKQTGLNSFF
ncbi:flap endonuclease-1 [archaeon]|jgi:flap endonuclease-1|nr:flap endonuclease-1 [archaeon]MBT3450871.1 flap endonuclease-1 [archaeon]MBT6869053.1 flap endonuclease-1 [archaeon]MBT7193296.1 flap endonuclease-1 [archaeon]MBT7380304.1 flap endonuclease-1 [archaeon]